MQNQKKNPIGGPLSIAQKQNKIEKKKNEGMNMLQELVCG